MDTSTDVHFCIVPDCGVPRAPGRLLCAPHDAAYPPHPGPPPHPAIAALLKFFNYSHLPEPLQTASRQFHDVAWWVAKGPQNAETVMALRKLLEAKDCAVRAQL